MLTIEKMLSLPVFAGARVVAGHNGLQNQIRRVHIVSMPDGEEYDWTQGGELILSVGVGLRNNPDRQRTVIPLMVKQGISGFVLSVDHYLDCAPEIMVAAADRHHFPIIELPGHVAFVEVTEQVLTNILNEQYALQNQVRHIHQSLMDVVLGGGSLWRLLEVLGEYLERSITIESASFELQAYTQQGPIDEGRERSIEEERSSPEVIESLMASGIFKQMLTEQQPVYVEPRPEVGLEMRRIVAPIIVAQSVIGYMWIIGDDRELTMLDEMAIGQAATVAALLMYKERAVQETQVKMRGDFFNILLDSEAFSSAWLEGQAAMLDFPLNWNYQIMLVSAGQSTTGDLTALMNAVDGALKGIAKALVFTRDQKIVVVLQTRSEPDGRTIADALLRRLSQPSDQMLIGVGNPVYKVGDVASSYEQAMDAVTIAATLGITEGVTVFEDLGLLHWLQQIPTEALHLNNYYRAIVKLDSHDKEQNKQLLHTLEMYLGTGGVIKDASEQLFVHRNTLIYRLERVEALTGIDLRNNDHQLNLTVALKMFRLRGR